MSCFKPYVEMNKTHCLTLRSWYSSLSWHSGVYGASKFKYEQDPNAVPDQKDATVTEDLELLHWGNKLRARQTKAEYSVSLVDPCSKVFK